MLIFLIIYIYPTKTQIVVCIELKTNKLRREDEELGTKNYMIAYNGGAKAIDC